MPAHRSRTEVGGGLRSWPESTQVYGAEGAVNNIAEGNGKRSYTDRARFVDIACGSGLECAACIDALVARKRLDPERAKSGKLLLHRIVAMLHKLRSSLSANDSKKRGIRPRPEYEHRAAR